MGDGGNEGTCERVDKVPNDSQSAGDKTVSLKEDGVGGCAQSANGTTSREFGDRMSGFLARGMGHCQLVGSTLAHGDTTLHITSRGSNHCYGGFSAVTKLRDATSKDQEIAG